MKIIPSIFKRNNKQAEVVDNQTAYNIWNLLKASYECIESVELLDNFVHDRDLGLFMKSLLNDYYWQIGILEKEAKNVQMKVPLCLMP